MNPVCFLCDQPASRVCINPKCNQRPFICNGPCVKGMGEVFHTHDKVKDFISIQDLQKRVYEIKTAIDPSALHQKYINDMLKKVEIVKTDFNWNINNMMDMHVKDIKSHFKHQISKESQQIIDKIDYKMGDIKAGTELTCLFKGDSIFTNKNIVEAKIKECKEEMTKSLDNLRKTVFGYVSEDNKPIEFTRAFNKGMELKGAKQYQQAEKSFRRAAELMKSDYLPVFEMGNCLMNQNKLNEAQKCYKQSLALNPDHPDTYNNIGDIFFRRKELEEAVEWYNKTIARDNTHQKAIRSSKQCSRLMDQKSQEESDYLENENKARRASRIRVANRVVSTLGPKTRNKSNRR